MTELGISLGLSPRESVERFLRLVRSAEDLGVDAAWVVDSQLAMKDAYIVLALLAQQTTTLKVGPGVTNGVTRHETVVANAMATLAAVAPDRVLVGFGAGDSAVYPLGRKPLSIRETGDAVTRLRRLLGGGAVDGPGGDLQLSFRPDPVPPVYLAASQPRMLRLAGEVADGVIIMGPSDPETVRMQLASVDEGAVAAGRDPSDIHRDLWVTFAVGDDAVDDVKSWASAQARWLAKWAVVPESLERFRPEMDAAAASYDFATHLARKADHASTVSDDFARVLAVAGTEGECLQRLSDLVDTGLDRVTLTLLSGGRERRLTELTRVWNHLGARAVSRA
ncbi:MAG: class flavin-dependent oxidoreductase [Acidimicrobiales bacterium]|nr:class flavin-dependent oxidoreductase [Acidimicrobiales bacterium]